MLNVELWWLLCRQIECQNSCHFAQNLFGTIVGAATCRPYAETTELGKSVDNYIGKINDIYKHVSVEQYVIMPNHVQMIVIVIGNDGRQIARAADCAGGRLPPLHKFFNMTMLNLRGGFINGDHIAFAVERVN
jgi:hypothetical protein